jgi:hypothetical protein
MASPFLWRLFGEKFVVLARVSTHALVAVIALVLIVYNRSRMKKLENPDDDDHRCYYWQGIGMATSFLIAIVHSLNGNFP